jgi:hypothetical protein
LKTLLNEYAENPTGVGAFAAHNYARRILAKIAAVPLCESSVGEGENPDA